MSTDSNPLDTLPVALQPWLESVRAKGIVPVSWRRDLTKDRVKVDCQDYDGAHVIACSDGQWIIARVTDWGAVRTEADSLKAALIPGQAHRREMR